MTAGDVEQHLCRGSERLRRFPVRGRKLDAPKVGRRGDKFKAEALAPLGGAANIDHAAFLILFGGGTAQGNQGAHLHFRVQIQQGAVRVDHDGLRLFGEAMAAGVAPRGANVHARKNARAASFVLLFLRGHTSVSCPKRGAASIARATHFEPARICASSGGNTSGPARAGLCATARWSTVSGAPPAVATEGPARAPKQSRGAKFPL